MFYINTVNYTTVLRDTCRGRNSVLTMHGHNVQALLILIGH